MTNINELKLQVEKIRGAIVRLEDKVLASDLPEYKELLDMQIANLEATEAAISNLAKSVEVKPAKRAKLTPAQEKTFNRIRKPNIAYKNHEGRRVGNIYFGEESDFAYSWLESENTVGCLENSSTLKALEKKGYIKIVELGGALGDVVEILEGLEIPEVHEKFTEITIQYGNRKHGFTQVIHTLPGKEEEGRKAHNSARGEVISSRTVKVYNRY